MTSSQTAETSAASTVRSHRRGQFGAVLLALFIAALVVIPRSYLITRAHSETWDEQYHLMRGLRLLDHSDIHVYCNDAPLGQVLMALPLWLAGSTPIPTQAQIDSNTAALGWYATLYTQKYSPQTVQQMVAIWKSILFLPFVAVVFLWARQLYGKRAGWLALALVLIEPTIAAHIPIAALDVLGMEGIVIACYLVWRYFERPTAPRLIAAGVMTGAAMLIKHTAVIMPGVVLLLAIPWLLAPRRRTHPVRAQLTAVGGLLIIAAISLWPLTLFDYSRPADVAHTPSGDYLSHPFTVDYQIADRMVRTMPAGVYFGSLIEARHHAQEGHPAILFGEQRYHGWWYYFPVVATYKVPIGFAVVLLIALLTFPRLRPRFDEWALLIPFAAFSVFVAASGINIGFRHALPAYAFLLLFAARAATARSLTVHAIIWLAVAGSFFHTLTYHPDYLSYINFPRAHAWQDISDSNIDWGQSLKQIRHWLDTHPTDRPVTLGYWGRTMPQTYPHYLDHLPVHIQGDFDPPPTHGILIISPIWVVGTGDPKDRYAAIRALTPVDTIGHSMLVYDLDRPPAARSTPAGAGNLKHQAPNKHQYSSTNDQNPPRLLAPSPGTPGCLRLSAAKSRPVGSRGEGVWNWVLGIIWNLVPGAWCLRRL